ncbi:DMT family transporter [Acidithiobacillus sp. M4-SHS-6]|uniref:DMT family transporter n=1 Tax=Acidithiobacillus sp. M4-SHS-6 TaxID=3383024 RepID=UPI0039BDC93E
MSGSSEHSATVWTTAWWLPLLAAVGWGGMFPVAKQALAILDPVSLTLLRYIGVTVLLLAVMAARKEGFAALGRTTHHGLLFSLGTVGIVGFNVFMLFGLRYTTPERASTMMAMLPFATAAIRWAMTGVRPKSADLLAFVVATAGVALLVTGGDPAILVQGGLGWGDALVTLGMLCWAIYTYGAGMIEGVSGLRYTTWTTLYGTMSLAVLSLGLATSGVLPLPSASAVVAAGWELGYMISFAGVIAIVAWNSSVRRLGAPDTALFINFIPITAFVWEAVAGRSFSAGEITGAGLIIAAAVGFNLHRRYWAGAPGDARPEVSNDST